MKIISFDIQDKIHADMAFAIRHKVFVEEQKVDGDEEYDEYESIATHYLVFVDDKPAATSRWRHTDKGIKLERFSVLPEFRNKGIGKALFQRAIRFAVEQNAGRLEWQVLDWNEPAIGFYRNFGAELDPTWINCKFTREKLEQLNASI
jgi:GNAT superfamily N-acetyltransferase